MKLFSLLVKTHAFLFLHVKEQPHKYGNAFFVDKGPQLQERSKSADALQYVTIQQNDNTAETLSQGGDRKRKITHSFREIFGGNRRKSDSGENRQSLSASGSTVPNIARPALPPLPPLPPPPSVSGYNVTDGIGDAGHHDLRQRMRLDGLIAAQPDIPPGVDTYDVDIDVDRYDRVVHTRDGDRVLPMGIVRHQNYLFPDSFDDVGKSITFCTDAFRNVWTPSPPNSNKKMCINLIEGVKLEPH